MPSLSDWTKSQVDRLGDRLREGDISDDDLRLLDSYRRSFTDAYENVVGRIRGELGLEPTGRPAKSTTSITDKLKRESVRLSQMQDIAGCRLTVPDLKAQDEVVVQLNRLFDEVAIVDRREHPSHGYRAVHVVAELGGKLIEIQVRTSLQHLWAEVSEKISDVVDPEIKYGEGDKETLEMLSTMSEVSARLEKTEARLSEAHVARARQGELPDAINEVLAEAHEQRQRVAETLDRMADVIPREKRRKK